ncbi:PAS domain S-box protein [Reyranella sp.]|uniref:PAS domain-containing sensor histidine kinase n=1 Tax=Reyranella sp. TaxID=1929291 RepID=UPI001216A47C|nr:PAS domain S-box protein [Reyranella sp.]TAJ90848.1 MAG: PAS domain-containing sensor histidine kinase [Reyranella sp.]
MSQSSHFATSSEEVAAVVAASAHAQLLLRPDLRIITASDGYCAALGLGRSALVDRTLDEVFAPGPGLDILKSSLEAARETHRPHRNDRPGRLLAQSTTGSVAGLSLAEAVSSPVLASDGTVMWLLHGAALPGEAGRTHLAQALEAAEARLRSVLQTVPDAMIIIDERGRIESLSTTAERLFGFSTSEVVGQNISMLMPSPYREQHDAYIERYLSTRERRIIGIGRIVVGQRKDGTTFPMHLTVGELQAGERHHFTGFIRDLTDQQMTESRLKELQSEVTHMSRYTALGEMASTLAHEINQPLTAISNYLKGSQRLIDRLDGEPVPQLRDAVGKAAEQALRAGQIIRRLREFVSRGESERRIESLPKLIEDASTLALVGIKEAGVEVRFRLDPRADQVLADRIQIQQVLVNLIRNAIEVMADSEPPRTLDIATAIGSDDTVEVSVADTGGGLAPEIAHHLFQPFMTTKRKGMGLGLSICRTIVEAHGGKIWVEARAGGGTVFRFTLRGLGRQEAGHGR